MTKRAFWKQILKEYCSENIVLAARFLVDRNLTKPERAWWMFWIGVVLAACIPAVVITHHKWTNNPVVIVFASSFEPVMTIPFPAITICPVTKARRRTFKAGVIDRVLDEDSEMKLRTLSHLCPHGRHFNDTKMENIVATLRNISFPMEDVMVKCVWRWRLVPCRSIMTEVLVDDGICYTFNSLAAKEIYREDQISPDFLEYAKTTSKSSWTQNAGYQPNAGLNAFPHRPIANGISTGLILVPVIPSTDQQYYCRGPYSGYKLLVHTPDEIPYTEYKFFRINTWSAITLTIIPEVIKTSETLRSVPPRKRGCYFADERRLRFFNSYSLLKCAQECMSNFTMAKCGCVKFSMPRSVNMPVCDASRIGCYTNVVLENRYERVQQYLKNSLNFGCECLSPCHSIKYDMEISQSPLDFRGVKDELNLTDDRVDIASIHATFKHRHFLPRLRRGLLTTIDALAQLGGFFVLLLGASAMSLAEICYYCCIRPLRRERVRAAKEQGVLFVRPWTQQTCSSETLEPQSTLRKELDAEENCF